jgi:hypothetical protein
MRVFKHHQYRPATREGFELMKKCFEQLLSLALRAKIEISSGMRQ